MQATVGIFGGWIWLKWNVSAALKIDKSSRWFQGNINGLIRYVQLEIGALNKQGVWCLVFQNSQLSSQVLVLVCFSPVVVIVKPQSKPQGPKSSSPCPGSWILMECCRAAPWLLLLPPLCLVFIIRLVSTGPMALDPRPPAR